MMELFKGYVKLDNEKKSVDKFKGDVKLRTLENAQRCESYAGVLRDEVILVDIDDYEQSEILMDIVEERQLRCRVYETSRGKHFYFLNAKRAVTKAGNHLMLACGLTADIKIGTSASYGTLRLGGKDRELIYDILDGEEYEELPQWLLPVKANVDFTQVGEGDGRNQMLFNYILTLQSAGVSPDSSRVALGIINDKLLAKPLPQRELEVVWRDDAFSKEVFFKGNQFLFDKFAMFLKTKHNVVKINGQLHIYDGGIYVEGQSIIEGSMIKHIPGLSKAKRSEVLSYLNILIQQNEVPCSANKIAFRNGVLDIITGEFRDFDPSLVITNKIDWDYVPDAYSEIADKTLDKMACHNTGIRHLLEQTIGYMFYRRNELRKAFILIGDKANGKSTFLDMIKTLVGDKNTSALDLAELGERFKTAELFGKLANIGDDIGDEFIANPAVFKKLVSGDRVNVERKGQDPFDFNNYAKFLFSANTIPRIKDKTGAVMDRMIIVPFRATFSVEDEDYDPYIKYKLREPEVMEYLIQVGIRGLREVLADRQFSVCEEVQAEMEEYAKGNDPALMFFEETEDYEIFNVPTKDVYLKYQGFCALNNVKPVSNIEFSRKVKKHFGAEIKDKKVKGQKYRIFVKE